MSSVILNYDYVPGVLSQKLLPMLEGEYSVDNLRDINKGKQIQADNVLNAFADFVAGALGAKDLKDSTKKDFKLVVDLTDEQKQQYLKGELKLVKKASGEFVAMVRGDKGRFKELLAVSPEMAAAGVDPVTLATAIQIKRIEEQLEDIMDEMNKIGCNVKDVLRGQQNDRLSLFYSGMNLLMEADNTQNEVFRKMLFSQAIGAVNESTAKLNREMQDALEYLKEKKYLDSKKDERDDLIEEKIKAINQCFDIINKGALAKSCIYYANNEVQAMLTALGEYELFLEKTIVPNAIMLNEYDNNVKYFSEGTWGKGEQILKGLKTTKQQIMNGNEFYLGFMESGEVND